MDKTTGLPDLRSFTYEELETFLTGIGEKRFRAGQVFAWLSKGVQDFDEMTNLSKQLREKLPAVSTLSRAHIEEKYISKIDGTVKYLIGLGDGECVETGCYALPPRRHGLYFVAGGLCDGVRLLCLDP